MQLPDELLKKLRILTDKPVSPAVNKQLLPLLLHQNLSIQKSIPVLCLKYRCDLINHLLKNQRYPSENAINQMLSSVLSKILQYKIAQVLQLFILVLMKIQDDKKLLQVGYYELIKLGVKLPNLQTKQKIFQIILNNNEYFYKRKCKKVIMAIYTNYLQVFSKFLIYVPSYVSIIQLGLDIDTNSKKIINKQHPQRQPQLQEIFIDFSSQQLSMIKNQNLNILQNTKDKLNYYTLHKNCLNALKKIGDILNEFKVKQSQLLFTQLQVGQICRTIQMYLDRKGTIDQARFAKSTWMKRFNQLKKIKQLKSQKYMNIPSGPELILNRKQVQKPLLIQQVISRTNNYRLKYQVSPAEDEQAASNSRIMSVSNNFLKKGIGVGGGRTYLLNQKHQNIFKDQKIKNKRLYDGIIDKCFEQYSKDIQYKSFVDPNRIFQNQRQIVDQMSDIPQKKQQKSKAKQAEMQMNLDYLPAFSQTVISKNNNETNFNMNKSLSQSLLSEDDQQIQEINNLIQLAYSYKFT